MRAVISAHINTGGPPSLPEYMGCSNITATATREANQYSQYCVSCELFESSESEKIHNKPTKLFLVEEVNLQTKVHYSL